MFASGWHDAFVKTATKTDENAAASITRSGRRV
jgi:hypothetical protein